MSDILRWFSGDPVTSDEMTTARIAMDKAIADAVQRASLSAFPAAPSDNANGDMPIEGLDVTCPGALALAVATGWGIGTYTDTGGSADADATSTILGPFGNQKRLVGLLAPAQISIDTNQIPITAGHVRWALLGLQFYRLNSINRKDSNEVTIQYVGAAAARLTLTYGAEANADPPAKPTVPVDTVPLAFVRIYQGMAAVTEADLDRSVARPSFGRQRDGSGNRVAGGLAAQLADVASLQMDNCRPYVKEPQALNAMVVGIRPGSFLVAGVKVDVAAQTVTLVASPTGGKHRIALVYLDTTGTAQVAYGAEVLQSPPTTAVAPSFEGRLPIATYDTLDTTTTLVPSSLVDVRPFLHASRDVPNRYKFTAAGGETGVDIVGGWTFVVGSHGLRVYKNGLLLPESAYTEKADGTGITGLAALVAPVSGAAAAITSAGDLATITGLSGITTALVGRSIVISGADAVHAGTFVVEEYVSATSIKVANAANAGADSHNGTIAWSIAGDVVELLASRVAGTNPVTAHAPTHSADGSDPIDYSALGGLVAPGFAMWTTGDNAITIPPFAAVIAGKLRSSSATINLAAQLASGAACDGGTIGVQTWYYLYAYWSGGAMAIEVSVSAPDAARRLKSTDATRTYLGAIRMTSVAAKVRAFTKINRRVNYLANFSSPWAVDDSSTTNTVIGSKSNASDTVSAAQFFPPGVQFGDVMALIISTVANAACGLQGTLAPHGGTYSPYSMNTTSIPTFFGPYRIGMDISRNVTYSTPDPGVTIYVAAAGYDE